MPTEISIILIQMILLLMKSKDASALAIYGTRAANGVIIITTKKVKGDGVTVEVCEF
jgi:TonB-dependent SusC/RagA subfamily outer membrane receptor